MRIFGHPVHPMLVHFPIVLWTIATGAYVSIATGVSETAAIIAKFTNGGGLIMAMLAMLAGLFELRSIDNRSEAMQVVIWHMMIMAIVWVCFLIALILPVSTGLNHSTAQVAAAVCAVVGFVLMSVGGWFGGRLVYEFGIAVKGRSKAGP